jgi:hypothetical protein
MALGLSLPMRQVWRIGLNDASRLDEIRTDRRRRRACDGRNRLIFAAGLRPTAGGACPATDDSRHRNDRPRARRADRADRDPRGHCPKYREGSKPVTGKLISVDFKEGEFFKNGDLLARIDPRTYQAQGGVDQT